MRAPLIADRTVARHRAWLFLLSFSETACTNGEDGKEFEGVAMDDLEKCSDYHVKTRIGCVKRVASWQGRLRVYIYMRITRYDAGSWFGYQLALYSKLRTR